MSIDSNSDVRSKYFSGQTDMDGSLSDFQEAKTSCKGPKPAVKTTKPKPKKVTKRAKGQRDIRTALKGKKNELVSYSKEFDTVCKKSGLDVDSEQLQLAIALSKSLQTESNDPETSQALSSQQRVAKIRKTLQEYGFKVPEAKITVGRKTKKFRKNYKLLTVTEEEKHQKITGKYSRILFENLDNSKVEHNSSSERESDARIFYVGSSIPYKCMKDNEIFYVDNLVEKSVTNGSLLRDWSEIPGRPESPKHIETYAMNFKDIDCSQDELDIVLSGKMKSVKDILAAKEIEYKKIHKECNVPKLVTEDEEKVMNDDISVTENKSPFQKAFNMKSPAKMFDTRSPVKKLFQDKTLTGEEVEIISPIKHPRVKSPSKELIDIGTTNKLSIPQQYRSCSPDIFDDELSSIMETTKPVIILSQEYKTKVFSQEIMDLTQCANIPSQNSEKVIQLSQNVTKRRSNDFMEITECIVGSSQPIHEDFKEIDLTQSPEDRGDEVVADHSINLVDNVANVSKNLSRDSKRNTGSTSQNITDEQQITVLSNHPHTDPQHTEKEDIDLTQSSNEDDREMKNVDDIVQTPAKNAVESMDLTQSSNSTDTSLPLIDVRNSQSQASLDDTIILDKDEYIANGKVRKSFFGNEAVSQVFDLTQAPETSIEYNPSPVKACSNSFYEDFVHDHSENTENSKEIINADVSKEQSHSHNESKESNTDIDLTQDSSSSEDILLSQRPGTVPQNIPNNSSLGKQDDVSIDYDEIIMEDNINDRPSFKENEKDSSQTKQNGSSKSEVNNDIEIVCENQSFKETENDSSLTQQYNSSKSEVNNDIQIVDDNNDADSSVTQHYNSSKSEVNNDIEIVEDYNGANRNLSQQYNSSKTEVNNDIEIVEDYNGAESSLTQQYDSPKSEVNNDIEIVDDNNDAYSLTQQYNSSKCKVNNDIEIVDDINDADKSLTRQYDSSKSEVNNDIDIVDDYNDANKSLTQHNNSSKSEVNNDIEIVDDNNDANSILTQHNNSSESKVNNDIEIAENNNDADINSSQTSEVFQISDKELDYSLHKSRRDYSRDNFDFGGISILDNVTKLGSYRKSLSEGHLPNCSENKIDNEEDSFLPEVYVKKTEIINETTQLHINKDAGISPIKVQEVLKDNNGIINIKTPKNTEYIIKTVDVTPMVDYASMSTPQRNRELDKYGLKPLKRKRAIQILTHLFNQTHPTVQQLTEEDHPSPSKKPRTNAYTPESSPKRLITSPEKIKPPCSKTTVKSPRKFVYKQPRHETRVKDSRKTEIEKDRDMCSGLSPIRCHEFERDSNSISATSRRTDELERNRGILSEPSSNRLDGLEGVSNSIRSHEFERDGISISATSRRTDELERNRGILSEPSSNRLDGLERDSNSVRSHEFERDGNSISATSRTDELERNRGILSEPSSNRVDGLERDSNSISATSRRTDELESYRAILSHRLDDLERDSNSISATSSKRYDELNRDRDTFSVPANKIKEVTDLCGYEVTSEVAVLKSVDCNPEDWVFQKREKAKVHSCRVPLHIAFHNYVLSRRSLREAILKYEPVNIDVIHKDLVGYGHRYDPKDLLKFLDKKCITVKTTDNNARNNRR